MSRRILRAWALAAAVAMAMACGAVAPSAPASQRLVLHEADAGKTVTVHRGDTVEVVLSQPRPAPGVSLLWLATSSAPAVLRPTAAAVSPVNAAGGSYVADFAAQAAGSALLTAHGTQRCEAMLPSACKQPVLTFDVVVR
jgi:hypothetical protein